MKMGEMGRMGRIGEKREMGRMGRIGEKREMGRIGENPRYMALPCNALLEALPPVPQAGKQYLLQLLMLWLQP
jgi:hypothetical protein